MMGLSGAIASGSGTYKDQQEEEILICSLLLRNHLVVVCGFVQCPRIVPAQDRGQGHSLVLISPQRTQGIPQRNC